MSIRKTVLIKEAIETDGHDKACNPITRVVSIAVVKNPFAERFAEDLSRLFELGV